MRTLTSTDILHIWERGRNEHLVERALTLLAVATPESKLEELARLPIGQRDARLLTVRERTFGSPLTGVVDCPQCSELLEFGVEVGDIRVESGFSPGSGEIPITVEGIELVFRLPNSADLIAVAGCKDTATARQLLLQRCVLGASHEGNAIGTDGLSEDVLSVVALRMAECDPQAEILLNLECPTCGHRWQTHFDIVSFFWSEIEAQAQRLLREVHALARAYGWKEVDILAMSSARRHLYLQMVGGAWTS